MDLGKLAPPSDDRRWRLVGATLRRHGYQLGVALTNGMSRGGQMSFIDSGGIGIKVYQPKGRQ